MKELIFFVSCLMELPCAVNNLGNVYEWIMLLSQALHNLLFTLATITISRNTSKLGLHQLKDETTQLIFC